MAMYVLAGFKHLRVGFDSIRVDRGLKEFMLGTS